MIDYDFYSLSGSFLIKDVARYIECIIEQQEYSDETLITGINNINDASENEIIFLLNDNDISKIKTTKARICVTNKHNVDIVKGLSKDLYILISDNAYYSNAKALSLFYKPKQFLYKKNWLNKNNNIIGKNSFIHHSVVIGENSIIGTNVFIGHGVKIGANCVIKENASIAYTIIGDNVTIGTGCIIGQEGFGFVTHKGENQTIFHIGRVIIENNVSIFGNTVVDKGFHEDTVIGEGTLIDSLVKVAHNVKIGKGCIILSQVGIAGGTIIGNYCLIAGQVGLADYITVGDKASIAAKSGVTKDVPAGMAVAGFPAIPINEWRRQVIYQKKMFRTLQDKN